MIKTTPIKSTHRFRTKRERSRSPITRSMSRLTSPTPEIRLRTNRLLSPITRLDNRSLVPVRRSPMKGRSKRTPTKTKHTNYFTVSEDAVIIDIIKNSRQTTLNELADRISRPLSSLKNRISKYLIKLSESDLKVILDCAKSTPSWHAHFIPDGLEGKKLGGIVQNLGKDHSQAPSTASTMLIKRSPISKQISLVKKKRKTVFSDNKENEVRNMDLLVINTPVKVERRQTSGCCTPELIYSSKGHRGITALIDPTNVKFLPPSIFERFEQKKIKGLNLSEFMEHLALNRKEDLKENAEVLVKILKSFSISFNMSVEEIVSTIGETYIGDAISLKGIRDSLLEYIPNK